MAFQVQCGGCGNSYPVDEKFVGRRVKCHCGSITKIPSPPAAGVGADPLGGMDLGGGFGDDAPLTDGGLGGDAVLTDGGFGDDAALGGGGDIGDPFSFEAPAAGGAPGGGGFPAGPAPGAGQLAGPQPAAQPQFAAPSGGFTAPAGGFTAPQAGGGSGDAKPKKQKKPIDYKPLMLYGGIGLAVVLVLAICGVFFMMMFQGPSMATPQDVFAQYQVTTRYLRWDEQFDLLTPEAQDKRLIMAANVALPHCKNSPDLKEVFAKHGLADVPTTHREFEDKNEQGRPIPDELRQRYDAIEGLLVSKPTEKRMFYKDLIDTLVVFETAFQHNGVIRVQGQQFKQRWRRYVWQNNPKDYQIDGNIATALFAYVEDDSNENEVDLTFKKQGDIWLLDTADMPSYRASLYVFTGRGSVGF